MTKRPVVLIVSIVLMVASFAGMFYFISAAVDATPRNFTVITPSVRRHVCGAFRYKQIYFT
jgi:hypothetical protein